MKINNRPRKRLGFLSPIEKLYLTTKIDEKVAFGAWIQQPTSFFIITWPSSTSAPQIRISQLRFSFLLDYQELPGRKIFIGCGNSSSEMSVWWVYRRHNPQLSPELFCFIKVFDNQMKTYKWVVNFWLIYNASAVYQEIKWCSIVGETRQQHSRPTVYW